MDPEQYIKEGLRIVSTLMKQGNFQAALMNCQELLKVNPYDRSVQKLLEEIQGCILKENERKVDSDIEETMHLWKEGRFEDLMKIYTKLYAYAPNHKKLRKLIEKLQETAGEAQVRDRKNFVEKSLAAIKQLIAEKKYEQAIQAENELLSVDPLNADLKASVKITKDQIIEQKLMENNRLFESADFERQMALLDTLFAIDAENPRLKELAFNAKTHIAETQALAERIHLNESIVRMKELFKNQEYEMVIQAAEEIERLDPKNGTSKMYKKKADKTMHDESNRLIMKVLKDAFGISKSEYEKNPGDFVKI